MMTYDLDYIDKVKQLLEEIPRLKEQILNLKEKLTSHPNEHDAKRLKSLAALLKFFIDTLKKVDILGEILVDYYFGEMTKMEIANKYNHSQKNIWRIFNAKTPRYTEAWMKLAIYFYGIEAVRLEKIDEPMEICGIII